MAPSVDVISPDFAQEVHSKTKCLPLVFTQLTPELHRKAKDELGEESEEMVNENLKALRKLMAESDDDWTINPDDAYMLRFLRARKHDLKRTLTLIRNHYRYHIKYKDIFDTLCSETVQRGIKDTLQILFPYRTPSGCPIWVCQMGRWNPDNFTFDQMIQMGISCLERSMEYPITQICGIAILWDLKGVTLRHVMELTPSNLTCFFSGLQDAYPMRLKEIHVLNGYRIFKTFFYIVKPFMSAKMRNRIHFHGSDLKSLHNFIPLEILPEEYGGHLGPYQDFGFYDSLKRDESRMLKCLNYGYNVPNKKIR